MDNGAAPVAGVVTSTLRVPQPPVVRSPAPIDWLTEREKEVLNHLLRGLSNKAIARATSASVGFAVLTVMFAVSALAGAVQVLRTRPADAGRGVWWHSALVSGANLFVLLYLGVYGMIRDAVVDVPIPTRNPSMNGWRP